VISARLHPRGYTWGAGCRYQRPGLRDSTLARATPATLVLCLPASTALVSGRVAKDLGLRGLGTSGRLVWPDRDLNECIAAPPRMLVHMEATGEPTPMGTICARQHAYLRVVKDLSRAGIPMRRGCSGELLGVDECIDAKSVGSRAALALLTAAPPPALVRSTRQWESRKGSGRARPGYIWAVGRAGSGPERMGPGATTHASTHRGHRRAYPEGTICACAHVPASRKGSVTNRSPDEPRVKWPPPGCRRMGRREKRQLPGRLATFDSCGQASGRHFKLTEWCETHCNRRTKGPRYSLLTSSHPRGRPHRLYSPSPLGEPTKYQVPSRGLHLVWSPSL
jgi:hypothetical protein